HSSRPDRRVSGPAQAARGLQRPSHRCRRWLDLLWGQFYRPVPPRRRLRRSYSQGREASRHAGAGAEQVRAGYQPQDRQGARPRRAAVAARPRRRGDRMRRREFILTLGGAAAWPFAGRAQQPAKMLRVGTVAGTPKSSPHWAAFERRMGELGYQEGKNFTFDFLQAASADEYEVLYRKLVANAPDVILAIGPEIGLKSAL